MKPQTAPRPDLKGEDNPRRLAFADLLHWLKNNDLRLREPSAFKHPGGAGLYRELISSAVRHKNRLMALIGLLSDRKPHELDSEAMAALMLGLVQLGPQSRVEPYAALNESVDLLAWAGKPYLKGLVNAGLRRYQREGTALEGKLEGRALAWSHPEWMLKRWEAEYGAEGLEQIAQSGNQPPQVWLVAHPELGVEGLQTALAEEGLETQIEEGFLRATKPQGLFDSQAFKAGKFFVQDPSAQLVAQWAARLKPTKFLDACAAPGGKLSYLLWAQPGLDAVATEPNSGRLKRLEANLKRLGQNARLEQGGAEDFDPSEAFDLVLADVPCSATGTIGKHPELKWDRSLGDIQRNQQMQLELLANLAGQVKPGGRLLYSTCSLEPEENQAVVEAFLAEFRQFAAEPYGPEQPYLRQLPRPGRSGSFAALMVKNP